MPIPPLTHSTAPAPMAQAAGALSAETLARLRRHYARSTANQLAQNALTQVTVDDLTLSHTIVAATDHTFSHQLDDWAVTNQKRTGRCWLFAGLNLLRVGTMRALGLKSFEFSQSYLMFWDKLERANYFLETIQETADRPVDDRTVAFLLSRPIEDGGQWNMFVNLVRKHGLVPKAFMPETESSSNSARMNGILCQVLREGAQKLRDAHAAGASATALQAIRDEVLDVVYRILNFHLGTPPEQFTWQWTDQSQTFHRDANLTPLTFAERYVELPLDEYVCLVNDPRPASPYGRTFTVEYLGNVVEGERVIYLNLEMSTIKEITQRTILDGEPVWFGCDVSKMLRRDLGLWDRDLFDYGGLYQTTFGLDKAARLTYHDTQMTHAMLFTGVDLLDGQPRRWRVENSWGDEGGRKGFYTMNDSWFDEYTFEIAARRRYLPPALQDALSAEPIVLPAWDPMGALAR
jgi:bleomycin hydrolase